MGFREDNERQEENDLLSELDALTGWGSDEKKRIIRQLRAIRDNKEKKRFLRELMDLDTWADVQRKKIISERRRKRIIRCMDCLVFLLIGALLVWYTYSFLRK